MLKFSPYISIYDLKIDFEALNEVIWTFSKNLKGIGTIKQRFNIHIVDHKDFERQHLHGSIKSIWKYFDQNKMRNESLTTQKTIILEFITECLLSVADKLDWDRASINTAQKKSIDDGIEFEFQSQLRLNQSKRTSGQVKLKLKKNKVSIYAILKCRDREMKEILMLDSFPIHISSFNTFREYRWINEEEFGFIFPNGITLTCSFNNLKSKWNHNDKEEDYGFIRSVTYTEVSSKSEMIEWMNK